MDGELLDDALAVSRSGGNLLESVGLVISWASSEFVQGGADRLPAVLLAADEVIGRLIERHHGPECMRLCLGRLMRRTIAEKR